MLNEALQRRRDFWPGVVVCLADGQEWTFPKPPEDPSGFRDGFGADYRAALEAVGTAEDRAERRRAELVLAIVLLDRNYDLEPGDYRQLLDYPTGGEQAKRLQDVFAELAGLHLAGAVGRSIFGPSPSNRVGSRRFEGLLRLLRPCRRSGRAAFDISSPSS